ncbi:MAG: hypothetical protein HYZ48_00740 [Chlamydiales bacterium]|nr:hypothetical protein [Chlamydiales bacterium]
MEHVIKGKSIFLACSGLCLGLPSLHADAAYQKDQSTDLELFKKDTPAYFAQGEYLLWRVNEGAVDYAVKMDSQAWSSNSYAVGNFHNAEFDWSSGFRVAFGYFRAPHFWDMFLQYTYLPSYGNKRVEAPTAAGEFLNGTYSHPNVETDIDAVALKSATSHINLNYHVLDFLSSRRFYPNEHLRLNLYGGITSSFLYQKWNVYYEDLNDVHAKIVNKWKFEGLGLKLGVKLDWYLGWDLYLTGLASSGILSGWYKNTAYERTQAVTAGANPHLPIHNTAFHDQRLAYTSQFMGSLSWQKAFETVRAELGLGYEFNIWSNLHQIYRSDYVSSQAAKQTQINASDLSLQGLVVRFNLDF